MFVPVPDDVHQGRAIAAVLSREVVEPVLLDVFSIRVDVGHTTALGGIDGSGIDEKAVGLSARTISIQVDFELRIEYSPVA